MDNNNKEPDRSKISLLSGLQNKIFSDDAEFQPSPPKMLSARSRPSSKSKPHNRPASANPTRRVVKKQQQQYHDAANVKLNLQPEVVVDKTQFLHVEK
jgi:hypothetical protein